jgi:hypothetical protein
VKGACSEDLAAELSFFPLLGKLRTKYKISPGKSFKAIKFWLHQKFKIMT